MESGSSYKDHPFYIFASGIGAGAVGVLTFINVMIADDYMKIEDAHSTEQSLLLNLQSLQEELLNESKKTEKLKCDLDLQKHSTAEVTINNGLSKIILNNTVRIHLDKTQPKEKTNDNKYKETPYSAYGNVYIIDGNINKPFEDEVEGTPFIAGKFTIYIVSVTNDTATFSVINLKLIRKTCEK